MGFGLVAEAASVAALAWVDSVGSAFVVATAITVGTVGLWPAMTAMMTRLVPDHARERVYGIQFMTLNAGLGVGGLVASTLVDVSRPETFERLYYLDALSYVVFIVIVATLPRGTGGFERDEVGGDDPSRVPGWSTVLRDSNAVRLTVICILAITFGYAQMEAGFAAYAVDVAGIPPNSLGLAFGANTGVIVVGQLFMLRLIPGRSRSRLLAVAAVTWSLAWCVIALSAPASGTLAVVCAVVGLGIFGLAETLWAPVAPAIYNAMASEELRGRYNALQSMVWTIGSIIGPAIAGLLIGHGLASWWAAATVGGTLAAGLGFLRLRRHLTPFEDGTAGSAGPAA
jgi:MFS family permease